MASPAPSGRSLILRTKTHLYRIEEVGRPGGGGEGKTGGDLAP
jgi:hypothetical protein